MRKIEYLLGLIRPGSFLRKNRCCEASYKVYLVRVSISNNNIYKVFNSCSEKHFQIIIFRAYHTHPSLKANGESKELKSTIGQTRSLSVKSVTYISGNAAVFGLISRKEGEPASAFGFTDQEMDSSGLIYMNARYYDPICGWFISPDPIVQDPFEPPLLNRYTWGSQSFCDLYGNADTPFC